MMRNQIDIRAQECQHPGIVHPSLVRLCAGSSTLLGIVLPSFKENPQQAMQLVNRVVAAIPKTRPLVAMYAQKIEEAAVAFEPAARAQILELASSLKSSISEPLTDLASLFQKYQTAKVLRFMSIDPSGATVKDVDCVEIRGTCLVKQCTVHFDGAPAKKFFLKYDCSSDLRAMEVLAGCQRGPRFLPLLEPSTDTDTQKHAALMPFEGPEIFQCPSLTPEVGFDAGLALSQMHALGISHRDLAPWHVRVRDDGSVFFIDFSNHSVFDPSKLHSEIRDIKLQNSLLADIGDLVSMIEYAPNATSLDPMQACRRAYRSTDFYKRLLDALLSAHQYTHADELCSILNSDDADRSQVHLRQQLTLQVLADGITSVTRSTGTVLSPYPAALQLQITTELDGHTANVTATFLSGSTVRIHLQSTEPALDLTVSGYDALARFGNAALAKAPSDLCSRAELERLCRRVEPE